MVAGGPRGQLNQRCYPNDECGLPKSGEMARLKGRWAGGGSLGNGGTKASRDIREAR